MDEARRFYIPPTQEVFEEIKGKAIEIWNGYDDTYGYATWKIDRIKDMPNHSSNAMVMIQMFDMSNQSKLFVKLGDEGREFMASRLPHFAKHLLFLDRIWPKNKKQT